MRLRWLLAVCAAIGLAAWVLARPPDRGGPEPAPAEAPADPGGAPRGPDLAPRATPAAPPIELEPPPAASPGTRRLHLVGVGPPDRPVPEVAFEVWTYSTGADAQRVRTALTPHRTAPNEAWFAVPDEASGAWLRATADRGRLASLDRVNLEMPRGGPDPQTVRVPLFASGELVVKVVDDKGRPLASASVVDQGDEARGPATDARGLTRLRALAGPLSLHAVAPGHASSERLTLTLAPGAREERTLVCGPGRAVVGRAVDEGGIPLSGLAYGTRRDVRERCTLAADGSFRFDTLPLASPGPLELRVSASDRTRSATASVPEPFPAGDGPLDLGTVRFVSLWRVPVEVRSARGEPLVGVLVSLLRAGASPDAAVQRWAEEAGTTFTLADGTYAVEVKPFAVRAPATIEVRGPWRGPPATVVLEDAFVVRGACVYRGPATPRWAIVMVRARAPRREDDVVARLDAAGRFAFPLPESLREAALEVETPYATLVPDLRAPRGGSDLVVDLPPEQALTLVVRAVDAADRPIPFQWARFDRVPSRTSLPEGWFGGPSGDGEVTFWPLPRGDYRVSVDLWDGTRAGSETFTLDRDGQVTKVRFER